MNDKKNFQDVTLILLLALMIAIAILFTGCKKAEETGLAAQIVYFNASEYSVPAYKRITLKWLVRNASMVMISEIGLVDPEGSIEVNPQETATFTLLAIGLDKETVTQKLTIGVDRTPACSGLQIGDVTGVRDGMKVEVGPNTNAYYSAKNVIVKVKLFDSRDRIIETGTGEIAEIPPGKYRTAFVPLRKSGLQARSECSIVDCSCDFTEPK